MTTVELLGPSMQQTTKVMFAYYKARKHALDVVWMQRRRLLILYGDFSQAMVKHYCIYSDTVVGILARRQEYPSPLFERNKHD